MYFKKTSSITIFNIFFLKSSLNFDNFFAFTHLKSFTGNFWDIWWWLKGWREDASKCTRPIYSRIIKSLAKIKKEGRYVRQWHHFTQYRVEFTSARFQDIRQSLDQANPLRRANTNYLPPPQRLGPRPRISSRPFI